MRFFALALCLSVAGAQAGALSCLRPNLGEAFNRFHASPDRYTLALGKVIVDAKDIPTVERGVPLEAPARFIGRTIGPNGLATRIDRPVVVRTSCVASWCGGVPQTDQELIVFLRHEGEARVLDMPACPDGNATVNAPGRVKLLRKCLAVGGCTDAVVNTFERK